MAKHDSSSGRFIPGRDRERVCLFDACKRSLAARKPQARWCSRKCRTYWVRAQRRRAALFSRPRCLICSSPMPYRTEWQGKGVGYYATTCSYECHVKRSNWFTRKAA